MIVFFVSLFVTYRLINIFRKKNLVDIPNQRSSHKVSTPKGGGISIVTLTLISLIVLLISNSINLEFGVGLAIGLIVIATTGFVDDIYNLSIFKRVVLYGGAVLCSILILSPDQEISFGQNSFQIGVMIYVLYAIYSFWILNLFNFMDGTDGYAAIQTLTTSLFSWILLGSLVSPNESTLLLIVFSATLGFLVWNWSPAKIFMGDVGSCSIGFIFAIYSIFTVTEGSLSLSVWLILLSPFIGDATFTLLKRVVLREKWYHAHNGHAYQKLYQTGINHRKIAIGLLVFNILFIFPMAYHAHFNNELELYLLVANYAIIGLIWSFISCYHYKNKNVSHA